MTEKTTQAPKRTRGERQKDSVYSQRYDNKRQATPIQVKLYADDEQERELIEKLEELKAQKKLKSVFIQALTEYFAKN